MKLTMHQPAIVINRVGAVLIDIFLISVLYGIIVAIITGDYTAMVKRFNVSLGDYRYDLILAFGLIVVYFIILPFIWKGYTVGKRFTRTRIVKNEGEEVGIGTLAWRFILLLIPSILLLGMPIIINIYIMLFRRDNRGYHDLAASTKVICK